MDSPTCEELWNEELELVKEDLAHWRHGTHKNQVYYREDDSTYWRASFRESTDGETNGLREGDASIEQVYPKTIQTIIFSSEKDLTSPISSV
jgi:hypothetical protein